MIDTKRLHRPLHLRADEAFPERSNPVVGGMLVVLAVLAMAATVGALIIGPADPVGLLVAMG